MFYGSHCLINSKDCCCCCYCNGKSTMRFPLQNFILTVTCYQCTELQCIQRWLEENNYIKAKEDIKVHFAFANVGDGLHYIHYLMELWVCVCVWCYNIFLSFVMDDQLPSSRNTVQYNRLSMPEVHSHNTPKNLPFLDELISLSMISNEECTKQ